MARYKGLFVLSGSVSGYTFYTLNGKKVMRRKPGFNREAFENNPNQENIRMLNKEFGDCSRKGKAFRLLIHDLLAAASCRGAHHRFCKVLVKIKNCDVISPLGERTISNGLETEEGSLLLKSFSFNEGTPFEQAYKGSISIPDSENLKLRFIPKQHLKYPATATHAFLQAAKVGFDFDSGTGTMALSDCVSYPIDVNEQNALLTFDTVAPNKNTVYLLLLKFGTVMDSGEVVLFQENSVLGVVGVN